MHTHFSFDEKVENSPERPSAWLVIVQILKRISRERAGALNRCAEKWDAIDNNPYVCICRNEKFTENR